MTDAIQRSSLWARSKNWLYRFDDALDYDNTQYTFDRVGALQQELATLKSRVEQLEVGPDWVSGDSSTEAAA